MALTEPLASRVVILGGGPAGLTAAYELGKANISAIVLEKDAQVGGLAKTVEHQGYRFDIGGHRFFTKVEAVERIWREVLPAADFLRRPRLSRIYYRRKFFPYPLKLGPTLRNLGLVNSLLIGLSYLRVAIMPKGPEETFEQWVTNRFGRRLYQTFFKTYTEKVWGAPCSEIRADWAAQRIRGLSVPAILKNLLWKPAAQNKAGVIKTLIEEFDYPRLGPGMMWERMSELVAQQGGEVRRNADVTRLSWHAGRVAEVEIECEGRRETVAGDGFISSLPLRDLIRKLDPPAPPEVRAAADKLSYRDFLIVALIVNRRELFPDNWLYIHEPEIKLGRIQNFKNWSADMVPDAEKTCLGLEYFCFEGDGLWNMTDAELLALGRQELAQLGLAREDEIEDGKVMRVTKAYPVYDAGYREALATVREFLATLENLQLAGRNGLHKYNNQDHSMLTAMLAARNHLGEKHDVWGVNADEDYHEESTGAEADLRLAEKTQPLVPQLVSRSVRQLGELFVSVIMPVYNGAEHLPKSLPALLALAGAKCEIIVVNDSSTDDSVALAKKYGARVIETLHRQGPAAARNLGARYAQGEILFFVDADVVVKPCALNRLRAAFGQRPDVAAVFGSYDAAPAAPNFVSQYKNLAHHFFHQQNAGEAATFWAGCGAVRREAFVAVGGFDAEQFPAPAVEDIELGYRLRAAGWRIWLDKDLQAQHLKCWTAFSLVQTDIAQRAWPWARLLLQRATLPNELNVSRRQQFSAVLVVSALFILPLSLFRWHWLAPPLLLTLAALALNYDFYRFFVGARGWWFALRVVPLHLLYFLYSSAVFALCWAWTRRRPASQIVLPPTPEIEPSCESPGE